MADRIKIKNLTEIYYNLEKVKEIVDSGIDILLCFDADTGISFLQMFGRFAICPRIGNYGGLERARVFENYNTVRPLLLQPFYGNWAI